MSIDAIANMKKKEFS